MTKFDSANEDDTQQLHEKYLAERDQRLRADGNRQYIGIEKEFASYADDPRASPEFSRAPVVEDIDVLIVGGGLSGLISAGSLVELGIANFRIIDRAADFGGTWYWNRYPGCRCDVDSYIYFPLIEKTNTVPPEKYSRASVIYEHARSLGRQLNLYERAYFQTSITEIRWNPAAKRWLISTDRGDAIRSRFVILGRGQLNQTKLPGIPGLDTFKGKAFHTSRWDYAYTGGNEEGHLEKLRDKKVAVIGTGATGVQVIPPLSEWAQRLYVVQRTPAAVDPR